MICSCPAVQLSTVSDVDSELGHRTSHDIRVFIIKIVHLVQQNMMHVKI